MLTFKNILFPVDLSPQCHEAAPFVRAIATRFGARVTMLHAMEFPPYWYGSMGPESFAAVVDLSSLTEQRKKELDSFLAQEFAGLSVARILDRGDPAGIIEDFVKRSQVDLIMMPTHGYGPFRRLLLGSVTAKVLHDLTCPIWTGVHAERQVTHPDVIDSMLCAVDLTEDSVPLIQWAADLASIYKAKLRLVHAVPGAEISPDQFFDSDLEAFLTQMARDALCNVQQKSGTALEVCIARGDVAKVVREATIHHDAGLVVIGRGLIKMTVGQFRTHAYSIIRETPCPVLSV